MRQYRALPAAALLPFLICACGAPARLFAPAQVEARLAPCDGGAASGRMTFRQQGKELLIQGEFNGLAPGAHGLHINEGRDCGGKGARNAGPHFNPTGARHGSPAAASHHAGDLPMLSAGADGSARFQARMPGLSLDGGPTSVIGRTVTVSARPDNFTTQPDGDSGPNVACGVIGPAR